MSSEPISFSARGMEMNCSWKSVQLKMAKWNGQEESAKQDDGVREAGWLRGGRDEQRQRKQFAGAAEKQKDIQGSV